MADHHIKHMPLSAILKADNNPKLHATGEIEKSFSRFGMIEVPTIDESTGKLVAGHGRIEALEALRTRGGTPPDGVRVNKRGEWLVPVLRGVSFANPREADAYLVASNRLSELGGWDDAGLAAMLENITSSGLDLPSGADPFAGIGFDVGDFRTLVDAQGTKQLASVEEAEIPESPATPDSKLGEIYELGPHRLLCGDSTNAADVQRLVGNARVSLLWTDPPYNVAYEGAAGSIKNDDMSDEKFLAFLTDAFKACDSVMPPGAAFYIAHADTEGLAFRTAVKLAGWKLASCLVWRKDALVMGRGDYHWIHEPILYGWKLGAAHHAVVDRTQTTIWDCPRPRKSDLHPTMKPTALIERAIENSTDVGGVVLDTFGGSGSTLIAAARTGRRALIVELDPKFCDVIRQRWANLNSSNA